MLSINKARNSLTSLSFSQFLIIFLFFLAFFVRFWKVEYFPLADDGDEMAYIFAGQSLWERGVPISWSSFERPEEQIVDETVENHTVQTTEEFTLVQPWFDHLFFVPLVMGGFSELLGYHFPSMPPALLYRLPILLLSMGSLFLFYKIAEKMFDNTTALIVFILLAFSPAFIFIQRMLVAENFILFFLLLSYYFYQLKRPMWMLVIPAFLAIVTKLTGVIVVPIIFTAFFLDKRYKEGLYFAITTIVLAIAACFIYGYSINLSEFLNATLKQSHRLLGWSNPVFLFSHPGFYNKIMMDFSYYLILIVGLSLWFIPIDKQNKFLLSMQVLLFSLIWATSAEQDMLGWYKILWFVSLALSAGAFIKQKRYEVIAIFLSLTILNNIGIVRYPTTPLPDTQLLRAGVAAFVIVAAFFMYSFAKNEWKKNVFIVISALYVLQSVYITQFYFAALCKDRNCSTPLVTLNSVLKK